MVKGVLAGDGGPTVEIVDSGERRSKMAGHETSGRANPPHNCRALATEKSQNTTPPKLAPQFVYFGSRASESGHPHRLLVRFSIFSLPNISP